MEVLANTAQLKRDGIITQAQATEIEARSRARLMQLAVDVLAVGGILVGTAGLIFFLAEPIPVAVGGILFAALGLLVLRRSERFSLFGNSGILIGAGMLLGGLSLELLKQLEDLAAWPLTIVGGLVTLLLLWVWSRGLEKARFVTGAVLLMGAAMHIVGIHLFGLGGYWPMAIFFYFGAVIFGLGLLIDVRLVSALAIIPLGQMLQTGTEYWHAAYVFYSPESTLSILQMGLIIVVCLWAATRFRDRIGRHVLILMMLAFVVMNLCFLVGSLWGDTPGQHVWGPGWYSRGDWDDYATYQAARDAFEATSLHISEAVYSIVWAVLLIGLIAWSAFTARRGLLNASLVFLAIHVYTQLFETFGDEPIAYVILGLGAIPLAWGIKQADDWVKDRTV